MRLAKPRSIADAFLVSDASRRCNAERGSTLSLVPARGDAQSTRPTRLVLVVALALASVVIGAGCETIAGVDFDKARLAEPSDGLDGSTTPPVVIGPDGAVVTDGDGGVTSSCTPEPNVVTCADRCGTTSDNCNSPRECSDDCGAGKACITGSCECVSEGSWCTNRCGQTQDNCGRPVDCGGCDAGTCTNNSCNCVPEPTATTCAGKACGTAVNNCGQTVACGNGGACTTPGAICKADGSCCSDNGAACNGRCGGVNVTNNCGQNVGCPQQCASGQVCIGTSCCIPEPTSTTCAGVACGPRTNNCGQVVECPNTCAAPNTCGGGGAGPNGCGCTTTSNNCGSRCSGTGVTNCGQAVTCYRECDFNCGCWGGTCGGDGFCQCRPQQGLCP